MIKPIISLVLLATIGQVAAECDSEQGIDFLRRQWAEVYCHSGHEPYDFITYVFMRCQATHGDSFDLLKSCLVEMQESPEEADLVENLLTNYCDCASEDESTSCSQAVEMAVAQEAGEPITLNDFESFLATYLFDTNCNSRKRRYIGDKYNLVMGHSQSEIICDDGDADDGFYDLWIHAFCYSKIDNLTMFNENMYNYCNAMYGDRLEDYLLCLGALFVQMEKPEIGYRASYTSFSMSFCNCDSYTEDRMCMSDFEDVMSNYDKSISLGDIEKYIGNPEEPVCSEIFRYGCHETFAEKTLTSAVIDSGFALEAKCDPDEAVRFLKSKWVDAYCQKGHGNPEQFLIDALEWCYVLSNGYSTYYTTSNCLVNFFSDPNEGYTTYATILQSNCQCEDYEATRDCHNSLMNKIGATGHDLDLDQFTTFLLDDLKAAGCDPPAAGSCRSNECSYENAHKYVLDRYEEIYCFSYYKNYSDESVNGFINMWHADANETVGPTYEDFRMHLATTFWKHENFRSYIANTTDLSDILRTLKSLSSAFCNCTTQHDRRQCSTSIETAMIKDFGGQPFTFDNFEEFLFDHLNSVYVCPKWGVCDPEAGKQFLADSLANTYCNQSSIHKEEYIVGVYYDCKSKASTSNMTFDEMKRCLRSYFENDGLEEDMWKTHCDCDSPDETDACFVEIGYLVDTDKDSDITFYEFRSFLEGTFTAACEEKPKYCTGQQAFSLMKENWEEHCSWNKIYDIRSYLRRQYRSCSAYNYYILAWIPDMTIERLIDCTKNKWYSEYNDAMWYSLRPCYNDLLTIFGNSNGIVQWWEFRDNMAGDLLKNCSGGVTEWNFWGWLA